MRTSQPAACPGATSQALDALPFNEPATGFWELPNKLPWLFWAPPTHGRKAGEELQRSGLYLQPSEMHPGGDLGWKVRICRVCSQRAEAIAHLGPARGAFIPAISKVGFNDAVASAQAGDYTNSLRKLSEVNGGCAMLSLAQKGGALLLPLNYDAPAQQQSRSKGRFSLPSHLCAIYLPTVHFNYAIIVCTKLSVSFSG